MRYQLFYHALKTLQTVHHFLLQFHRNKATKIAKTTMHYQFSLVTAESTGTATDFQQTMVNMNLCTNDVNRQVPLMCHIAHNVGLMSTRV